MPKLLVLFQSRHPDVVDLAEAVVEGARSVRFAEVDLRRLPDADEGDRTVATDAADGRMHRTLDDVADITTYDGLILGVPAGATTSDALTRTIAALGASLLDKVGSAVSPARGAERSGVLWSALTPMADGGMILVPATFDGSSEPDPESARRLGKRVAEVIGWVTHARSHHHHQPHHEPQTHDDHRHDHRHR